MGTMFALLVNSLAISGLLVSPSANAFTGGESAVFVSTAVFTTNQPNSSEANTGTAKPENHAFPRLPRDPTSHVKSAKLAALIQLLMSVGSRSQLKPTETQPQPEFLVALPRTVFHDGSLRPSQAAAASAPSYGPTPQMPIEALMARILTKIYNKDKAKEMAVHESPESPEGAVLEVHPKSKAMTTSERPLLTALEQPYFPSVAEKMSARLREAIRRDQRERFPDQPHLRFENDEVEEGHRYTSESPDDPYGLQELLKSVRARGQVPIILPILIPVPVPAAKDSNQQITEEGWLGSTSSDTSTGPPLTLEALTSAPAMSTQEIGAGDVFSMPLNVNQSEPQTLVRLVSGPGDGGHGVKTNSQTLERLVQQNVITSSGVMGIRSPGGSAPRLEIPVYSAAASNLAISSTAADISHKTTDPGAGQTTAPISPQSVSYASSRSTSESNQSTEDATTMTPGGPTSTPNRGPASAIPTPSNGQIIA